MRIRVRLQAFNCSKPFAAGRTDVVLEMAVHMIVQRHENVKLHLTDVTNEMTAAVELKRNDTVRIVVVNFFIMHVIQMFFK